MRKGHYHYRVHTHHRPWLGWMLVGLAALFVIKALPFLLPLLLLFFAWQFVSRRVCCNGFDFDWRDSADEKRKRKNDDLDHWDDEPVIV